MSDLVLAQSKTTGRIAPYSRFMAELTGAKVLDESPYNPDGSLRGVTSPKPKTSVAAKAAEKKKAVTESADNQKEQS